MSIVQRTVEAFPRGRTTEELIVLLGAAFDEGKRRSILAELQALSQSGVIRLERSGRWTPLVVPIAREARQVGSSTSVAPPDGESLLLAVPGSIASEPAVNRRRNLTPYRR